MALVQFKIFGKAEDGSPIKRIDIECDFLPRAGDVFNTFDLFDDIEVGTEDRGQISTLYIRLAAR